MGNQEFVDFIKEEVKRRENKKEDFMENINKYFIEKEECACEGECEVCTCSGAKRGFRVVKDEFRKHPDVEIQLPKRGSKGSAGYDICTPVDIVIPPYGISEAIQTDIKAYMLDDEVLEIYPRSSIGFKKGLMLINTVGIIDSDYFSNPDNDGNIGFKFKNLTDKEVVIEAGTRILQGIFKKYLVVDDDDTDTERVGGIGSTGV